MSQYLKTHKWTYLRENIERSNSSRQRSGHFRISTGISKPRHAFVFQPLSAQGTKKLCLTFRAEKRSAQASAHPLSQAQGGLFCVLKCVDCTVCLFVTERVLTKTE